MKHIFLAFVVACFSASVPAIAFGDIYLVRHAEKEYGDNPPLSPVGRERAEALAKRLANTGLERIFSTDYERTLKTAEPAARQRGLIIEKYDPRALEAFAEKIKEIAADMRGSILVVGHSNTTPQLAEMITGQAQTPLEEHQYDRLYVLRPNIRGEKGHSVYLEYYKGKMTD